MLARCWQEHCDRAVGRGRRYVLMRSPGQIARGAEGGLLHGDPADWMRTAGEVLLGHVWPCVATVT
jgi:hypothetical protein